VNLADLERRAGTVDVLCQACFWQSGQLRGDTDDLGDGDPADCVRACRGTGKKPRVHAPLGRPATELRPIVKIAP
jgi:hypothetical protein